MFRKLTTKEEVAAAFSSRLLWVKVEGANMRHGQPEWGSMWTDSPDEYASSWAAHGGDWWGCYILVEDDEEG